MTNHDVQNMLAIAREKGADGVEELDVCFFLGAKAILAREPKHEIAKQVVKEFLEWLATGVDPHSFTRFLLPRECGITDEELAEEKEFRERHLAWVAEQTELSR